MLYRVFYRVSQTKVLKIIFNVLGGALPLLNSTLSENNIYRAILNCVAMKRNTLIFGGIEWEAEVRRLSDMKDVVYDQDWAEHSEDVPLYYMYRGLYRSPEDRRVMESLHLRYDITIIPPFMLGVEYVKTAGHYHPRVEGEEVSYTEVYQVLEGSAEYLLQRVAGGVVEDVVLIHAEAGDVVVIPPDYGHVTVNASKSVLKMSNWVSSRFASIYEPFRQRRGAVYYILKEGRVKNANYDSVPPLREMSAADSTLSDLCSEEDMYALIEEPSKLDFLNHPHRHLKMLNSLLSG
jgi:glucose-6-phosphate isomerase